MFILYGLLIGTIAGVALGGDVRRLSTVTFRWKPVVFAGLVFQVILFAPAVSDRVGDLGPLLYVASTLAVFAAVMRNARIPGLPVIGVGGIRTADDARQYLRAGAALVAVGTAAMADPRVPERIVRGLEVEGL